MRRSATIVHISSLPGDFGIGDIGEAIALAPWFASAGLDMQFLPLTDPADGRCPYTGRSAFARNWRLISPRLLVSDGLLSDADLQPLPRLSREQVEFDAVSRYKRYLLAKAFDRWQRGAAADSSFRGDRDRWSEWGDEPASGLDSQGSSLPDLAWEYKRFLEQSRYWLDDYALFCALKERYHGQCWNKWSPDLVNREPAALDRAREDLSELLDFQRFVQFIFHRQWALFKKRCQDLGIRLIGDIPIFVSYDSADVWAHQHLFKLDAEHLPSVVTGVPPDYFSADGQLWGNPHYNWEAMRQDRFSWWIERLGATLALVDTVRIDHFRGFDQAWEVDASARTAKEGVWVDAPGFELIQAMKGELGLDALTSAPFSPIIAEDLGLITDRVRNLRDRLGLPGMRVLQFGFGGNWLTFVGFALLGLIPRALTGARRLFCQTFLKDCNLPHNWVHNCVAYTGTHDNKTSLHWWETLSERDRFCASRYLPVRSGPINWVMIEACMASDAELAAFPLQDILGLGKEGLMNIPGVADGNWGWRFQNGDLTDDLAARVRETARRYGR